MNGAVLVLNQNYEPLNVCNVRRAILLVFDGKAEILEANGRVVKSATHAFPAPSVIRMVYLIHRPRPRVKLTRREVFIRDGYTCQYCGRQCHDLTIDHVVPRSRGGVALLGQSRLRVQAVQPSQGGQAPGRSADGPAQGAARAARRALLHHRAPDRGRGDARVVEVPARVHADLGRRALNGRGASRAAR